MRPHRARLSDKTLRGRPTETVPDVTGLHFFDVLFNQVIFDNKPTDFAFYEGGHICWHKPNGTGLHGCVGLILLVLLLIITFWS